MTKTYNQTLYRLYFYIKCQYCKGKKYQRLPLPGYQALNYFSVSPSVPVYIHKLFSHIKYFKNKLTCGKSSRKRYKFAKEHGNYLEKTREVFWFMGMDRLFLRIGFEL